jgi:hypothetical protein
VSIEQPETDSANNERLGHESPVRSPDRDDEAGAQLQTEICLGDERAHEDVGLTVLVIEWYTLDEPFPNTCTRPSHHWIAT